MDARLLRPAHLSSPSATPFAACCCIHASRLQRRVSSVVQCRSRMGSNMRDNRTHVVLVRCLLSNFCLYDVLLHDVVIVPFAVAVLCSIGGDTHTAGAAIAVPLRISGQQSIQSAAPTPTMFIIIIDPFCCNQTLKDVHSIMA